MRTHRTVRASTSVRSRYVWGHSTTISSASGKRVAVAKTGRASHRDAVSEELAGGPVLTRSRSRRTRSCAGAARTTRRGSRSGAPQREPCSPISSRCGPASRKAPASPTTVRSSWDGRRSRPRTSRRGGRAAPGPAVRRGRRRSARPPPPPPRGGGQRGAEHRPGGVGHPDRRDENVDDAAGGSDRRRRRPRRLYPKRSRTLFSPSSSACRHRS